MLKYLLHILFMRLETDPQRGKVTGIDKEKPPKNPPVHVLRAAIRNAEADCLETTSH